MNDLQASIAITIAGLDGEIRLLRAQIQEELNRPTWGSCVLLHQRPDIQPEELLGAELQLSLRHQGQLRRRWQGVVRELVVADVLDGWYAYECRFSHRLGLLDLWRRSRAQVFPAADDEGVISGGGTVVELLRRLLREHGFDDQDADLQALDAGSYSERESYLQFSESDLDFFQRWCEHEGIIFACDDPQDAGRLSLRAHPEQGPRHATALPVSLDEGRRDGLFALSHASELGPAAVELDDYNYRLPAALRVSRGVPGAAADPRSVFQQPNEHFRSQAEGAQLAGLRADELASAQQRWQAHSEDPRLMPGLQITPEPSPLLRQVLPEIEQAWDQGLLVVAVEHQLQQGAAPLASAAGVSYQAALRLHAQTAAWRPPRRSPWPQVRGLIPGLIHGHDPQAPGRRAKVQVDGDGRYLVRLPFAAVDHQGPCSRPLRLLQQGGGSNAGWHWPLPVGTEVMIACIDGDPDRMLILGAVSNPASPSVVDARNHRRHIIRSPAGHVLAFDDSPGRWRMEWGDGSGAAYEIHGSHQDLGLGLDPRGTAETASAFADAGHSPAPVSASSSAHSDGAGDGALAEQRHDTMFWQRWESEPPRRDPRGIAEGGAMGTYQLGDLAEHSSLSTPTIGSVENEFLKVYRKRSLNYASDYQPVSLNIAKDTGDFKTSVTSQGKSQGEVTDISNVRLQRGHQYLVAGDVVDIQYGDCFDQHWGDTVTFHHGDISTFHQQGTRFSFYDGDSVDLGGGKSYGYHLWRIDDECVITETNHAYAEASLSVSWCLSAAELSLGLVAIHTDLHEWSVDLGSHAFRLELGAGLTCSLNLGFTNHINVINPTIDVHEFTNQQFTLMAVHCYLTGKTTYAKATMTKGADTEISALTSTTVGANKQLLVASIVMKVAATMLHKLKSENRAVAAVLDLSSLKSDV